MSLCNQCPRNCEVNRDIEVGDCGVGNLPNIGRIGLHHYEEPPISGTRGSGAIFFCGCNLHCVFCQNFDISQAQQTTQTQSKEFSAGELAEQYLCLESMGAHNINLATPTSHLSVVAESIRIAKAKGIAIPFVWNSNGYETVHSLKQLEGLIDIYLPDYKYESPNLSNSYSGAKDYHLFIKPAIAEMMRQTGQLKTDADGIATRGVLIRHLVLPGSIDNTRNVLNSIASAFGLETHISLMAQYTPMGDVCKHPEMYPFLCRKLTAREYDRAVEHAITSGFQNVLVQSRESAKETFTPLFDGTLADGSIERELR